MMLGEVVLKLLNHISAFVGVAFGGEFELAASLRTSFSVSLFLSIRTIGFLVLKLDVVLVDLLPNSSF